jgi:DNA-directed RNA polymerase subunit RPC12/RpoP
VSPVLRSKSCGTVDYAQFPADELDNSRCPGCHGKVFGAERLATCFGSFHGACFKCSKCQINLEATVEQACSRNGQILCKRCNFRLGPL